MPQLVKGGKWVFGISKISDAGKITIPPPALEEYGFRAGDRVILMNGSRTSGGFGLTTAGRLEKSSMGVFIEALPELVAYRLPECEIVEKRGRLFTWMQIDEEGGITLPPETLSGYGLKAGGLLVVARGSGLAVGFIAKGPIFAEAMKHPELESF